MHIGLCWWIPLDSIKSRRSCSSEAQHEWRSIRLTVTCIQDTKAACICAKLMANFELLTFSRMHEIIMLKEAQLAVTFLLRNTAVIFFPPAIIQFTRKQKRNQAACKWCKMCKNPHWTEPNSSYSTRAEPNPGNEGSFPSLIFTRLWSWRQGEEMKIMEVSDGRLLKRLWTGWIPSRTNAEVGLSMAESTGACLSLAWRQLVDGRSTISEWLDVIWSYVDDDATAEDHGISPLVNSA